MPHGGPHHRATGGGGFDAQFFATRGFAVFQPNFRGSTGYGLNFFDADRNDFGGDDMKDILTGIGHLVADERFASQLALAQLLLNGKRFEAYADLATTVLVPAMLREDLKACDPRTLAEIGSVSPALSAGGFCLLPLMADDFVQPLSPKTLARLLPVWAKYRGQTESQVARLWIDRFLTLGFERLGRSPEAAAARERYETNPQQAKYDFYATFHSEVFNLLRQTFSLSDFLNSLGLAKRSPGL